MNGVWSYYYLHVIVGPMSSRACSAIARPSVRLVRETDTCSALYWATQSGYTSVFHYIILHNSPSEIDS